VGAHAVACDTAGDIERALKMVTDR